MPVGLLCGNRPAALSARPRIRRARPTRQPDYDKKRVILGHHLELWQMSDDGPL